MHPVLSSRKLEAPTFLLILLTVFPASVELSLHQNFSRSCGCAREGFWSKTTGLLKLLIHYSRAWILVSKGLLCFLDMIRYIRAVNVAAGIAPNHLISISDGYN